MEQFSKEAFLAASEDARTELCAQLAEHLAPRLRSGPGFADAARECVHELRRLGHDLWSFDEDEDFQIWCPNYTNGGGGPGLVLTFHSPAAVEVEWSKQ